MGYRLLPSGHIRSRLREDAKSKPFKNLALESVGALRKEKAPVKQGLMGQTLNGGHPRTLALLLGHIPNMPCFSLLLCLSHG